MAAASPLDLHALRRQSPVAVRALLERLLPRARNLVRYLIRGDADVDDITQQALVRVVRGLPHLESLERVDAWADRIVARVTFDWLKQRAHHRRELAALDLDPPAPSDPSTYHERRRVVEWLDDLPLPQRQVVVLHHVLGLSVHEVAEELGVPAETARSRLRLGMARLRERGKSEQSQEDELGSEPEEGMKRASLL